MSESELDFDADELAMLRQLFRTEAQDALEAVTTRVLAAGFVGGKEVAHASRRGHSLGHAPILSAPPIP